MTTFKFRSDVSPPPSIKRLIRSKSRIKQLEISVWCPTIEEIQIGFPLFYGSGGRTDVLSEIYIPSKSPFDKGERTALHCCAILSAPILSHSQSFSVILSHSQSFPVCVPSVYHADSDILWGYEAERTHSLSTTLCYLPNIGDVRNDNYQYMAIVCLEKCLHLCNVKNRCLTINIFTIFARRLCANK